MRRRVEPVQMPTAIGRKPSLAARMVRRIAFVVAVAMLLGVAIPPRVVPTYHKTPLSWLWSWFSTRPSWAFGEPPTPKQQRGKEPDHGHYVSSPRFIDRSETKRAKGELPLYEPYRPKVGNGSTSTGAVGRGFNAATSVRIGSAAGQRWDVYRNADGSYTRRVHLGPTNYQAPDGSWQPINSRLRIDSAGRPRVTANSFALTFAAGTAGPIDSVAKLPASADRVAEPSTPDDLVRWTVEPGVELAYSLAGATVGQPVVDREIARYPQVFPDVDLELGAMADGFKEVLTLRSANVPTEYVYPLRLTGLTVRIADDGAAEFVDDHGKVVIVMPVGYLEDSAVGPSGAGATSHAVRYEIVTAEGAPAIKVSIDGAWLRDPARKFPVRFDPTATLATTNSDTYVQSGGTQVNRASEDNFAIGTFDGGTTKAKSIMPFWDFDETFAGKRITAANLNLFMSYQGVGTGCYARRFDVHRVTSPWSYSTITYDTFPSISDSIGNASPSSTAACNNTAAIRNVGTWVAVPLDVDELNAWLTSSNTYGLALTTSLTDSTAWKRFTSANPNLICNHSTYGSIQCDPFLDVVYSDNVAPQVDVRYPSNNAVLDTLTPEFAAQGHDPDNWPAKGLRYEFHIYNDQGAPITTSGWVTDGVWKVPAGVLEWKKTYLYAVKVNDYSSSGPAEPVLYAFTTQVPQPMVTSSLAQNGGKGYEPSVGNYTTSDTDAEVTTVGPALSITRDYNSLDTRVDGAFGRGWSSVLDMMVREQPDADGVLQTAAVRYPDGQEVAFGRNNDGTWVAPSGRFSVFKPITGGYSLTDKDATSYEFTQPGGAGIYRISRISDASGRALTFRYDSNGHVDLLTSVSSGRTLSIVWDTPPNSAHPHVVSVTTNPATPGDPSTALTWTYSYDNDLLKTVCEPGAGTACTRYDYDFVSQHANQVLDSGPYSFWRLNEAPGETIARSSVLSNDGTDNATYSNVTLGGPTPLADSTSTSASFDGTSSLVTLPVKPATESSYQSISMWFRTSTPSGVLFGYQKDEVTPGATTTSSYAPVLYIGSDGKLYGQFWMGDAAATMSSPDAVTDGQWHHVALSGSGGSQRLYLDGVQVGSLTGTIKLSSLDAARSYLGAGFLGDNWPGQANTTPVATFFTGSMADVAFYNKAVTGATVAQIYASGRSGTAALSKITSAAGRVRAEVTYDTVTGRVATVTDENGGVWRIGAPTVHGSSQVYVSAVLGSQPHDYWRFGDIDGPADAVNVVLSNTTAKYRNVTFDTSQPNTSPFSDTYGAVFNGTSSYVEPVLPNGWGTDYPFQEPASVELWFRTPANHATSGVLYSYQYAALTSSAPDTANWTPALYVGADGYLRGGFWTGRVAPMTSKKKVNDGNWHHVVLASSGLRQALYLDNELVGTAGAMVGTNAKYAYIGAGATRSWPGASGNVSYFRGNIAEFAYYTRELHATEVDAHYRASRSSHAPAGATALTPVISVSVTDPTNHVSKQLFDLLNGNRIIATTDVLGRTTSYGYDVGGFQTIEFDPLGRKSVTARDVRGNIIRTTVCRDQEWCDSSFYKYWPDATTVNLTPDPRNDQLIELRDAGSADETDNMYLTKFGYDTSGNRISMTTPAVLGYPSGRTTTMTYTTATTPAVGGGFTPPGLPLTTRTPGGAEQRTEYNSAGDPVRIIDAGGLVTEFTYDGLGRVITKTEKVGPPLGDLTTTYVYDASGQVVEQTEPPVLNQVTGAIHTARTTTVYDPDGEVTYRKVEDLTGGDAPREATTYYNSFGQVVKTIDPLGRTTLFEYDVYGNVVKTTACASSPAPSTPCPNGDVLRVKEEEYDAAGQQLATWITGQDGTRTRISYKAYYADGNLASDTDAMNWTTKYEYDPAGRVTKVTRVDGTKTFVVEENSYDGMGNLYSQRRDNGANWTVFDYDNAGRLYQVIEQPYDLHRITTYDYDIDDRVVTVRHSVGQHSNPLQTIAYTYDPMGRVTSESVGVSSSAGPVGWWKMDEAGPSWEAWDSSPSQHLLSGDGGPIGRSGGAAVFNRTAVYATNQPVLVTTQSYSVSAWVRLADLAADQTIVGQGGLKSGAFFLKYSKTLNKWEFVSAAADASGTSYYSANSSRSVATNTWVHLVGVFDSGTKAMTLYVNGTEAGTATNATPWNTAMPLTVGGIYIGPDTVNMVNGAIDNVQVFQEALSAQDVSTLYGGGNGRTANTTVTSKMLTTHYTLDKRGLPTTVTDPMGNQTQYEYDAAGRLAKVVYPSVSVETFDGSGPIPAVPVARTGYNTFGEQTETQDPLLNTVTTRYDAAGRPYETILPDYTPPGGSPIVGARITTVYDDLDQIESITDPLGNTTRFEYDWQGNRIKVTDARGKVSTADYNDVGDLVETVDPAGAKVTATYDYLGRMLTYSEIVRQPTPVTNTTTFDYGAGQYSETPAAGPWLRKVTSPDGVQTSMTYNWLGERLTVTDGAGNTTTTEYDGMGRVVRTINPDSTKQVLTYDGAGRIVQVQKLAASGSVLTTEKMGYDDNGNLTTVQDARGTTTTFSYDALGRLTSEIQPVTTTSSISTSFGYDLAGRQTRFTDGRGNEFWTTYNSWGLPESRIEPATSAYPNLADRTFTVAYDAAGRVRTQTMPGGVRITHDYDELGRLRQMSGTGAEVATADRVFEYDDAGRMTAFSVPGGTNTLTYDDRGLLLSISGPNDSSSFTYTKDGRMATRSDAAGTTTYTYDNAGRLRTVGNPTAGLNLTIDYNSMSLPRLITYGTNGNRRTLTYDSLHRLDTDKLTNAAGTVTLGMIDYGYDQNGNLTSKTTTGFAGASTNTYTYDLANRLTSWTRGSTTTTYAYDASGNRIQAGAKAFTYDARNQLLTQSGGISYVYSPRGTLRQTVVGSVDYTTEVDAFGQVLSQEAAGGTTTYAYDALGRAVRPGFEYTGLGNDLARDASATYVRGPDGELLGVGPGSGAGSRYAWTDLHTDVVGEFTATGTTLSASASYDPLGRVLASTGMQGNLGFQSEWTDDVTDRVNMLSRWYNLDTGQFDTRDSMDVSPVPDSIRANRFQYGDGNPLTTVDPTGHFGIKSFLSKVVKAPVSAAKKTVSAVKNTASTVRSAASSAFKYVSSGRAWNDVKAKTKSTVSKAKKALTVVKDTTVRWAKKKVNKVKDAYQSAKKCVSGGASKCVKETAKKATKKVVESAKATVEAIKQDPWKFVATAAVAVAAAAAVGAMCATGVGCLIVAGAVAGAMSAGAGYVMDAARGDTTFSWSGLASTMLEGGLDGGLSAGLNRFTAGVSRAAGGVSRVAGDAAGSRLAGMSRFIDDGPSSIGALATPRGGALRSSGSAAASIGGGRRSAPAADTRGAAPAGCAPGQSRHSFDPSTRVLLADGRTKPIEDVQPGDVVASADPVTGETTGRRVTQLQ